MNKIYDTVIIGAGLTGLTTAHYLNKKQNNFLVLEKNKRTGGVIHSTTESGFLYEEGPNTGVIGQPEVLEVFEDLQDYCKLELADKMAQKRYILKGGKWRAIPSNPISGIFTPLFTFGDKLRVLGEPFRKPGTNPDETLSEFVKRRLGKSILDYAVDPFISGVYAGNPDNLIPRYALPKLYNLEQKYGSFIGGTIKMHKEKKREYKINPPSEFQKRVNKVHRKTFSAEGGLGSLTNALQKSVGDDKFVLDCSNITIKPENGLYTISYTKNGEQTTIHTKQVITTGGAYEMPDLLPFIDNNLLTTCAKLEYTKVVEIVIGFNNYKGFPLNGFGGLIPSKEDRDILGVLFLSAMFKNRAPENGGMLTVFAGGVRKPHIVELSDDKLFETVERELKEIMLIDKFNPDLFKIHRYMKAIPQYDIHSGARFDAIDTIEQKWKGLIIGGNQKDGIGMADRMKQGKILAEKALG